jgi:hypothetical protein
MPYFSFYASEEFRQTWRRFLEIARREGKNASILLREFVKIYVEKHWPGNPQMRLNSFTPGGPVEKAAIEGRVRLTLKRKAEQGYELHIRDIIRLCQAEGIRPREAQAMAERIYRWLREQNIIIWR